MNRMRPTKRHPHSDVARGRSASGGGCFVAARIASRMQKIFHSRSQARRWKPGASLR